MSDALDDLLLDVPPSSPSPDEGGGWQSFAPETGTLGIPRASMPQVRSVHRGAMVQFLKGRGITHEQTEVAPDQLKPSQAEFSPEKVESARSFDGTPRPLLVSSDDHVIDGHHQWLASLQDAPSEPIPAIRLNAPAHQLLIETARFPSSGVDESSDNNSASDMPTTNAPTGQSAPTDPLDDLLRTVPDAPKSSRAVAAPAPSAARPPASPASDDYRALSAFAEGHGFTVRSTTGGRHNEGSAHYAGRAVDVRTRDKTPEEVDGFMQNARDAGYIVRDERARPAGQAVWSGPHVHLEKRAPDELDALLDQIPVSSASASPTASPSVAPAGDELDSLLSTLPVTDEHGDEVEQANASSQVAPSLPPAAPQTFDPYTVEGRAARDAQDAAESQPNAVRSLSVQLPAEYSKLTPREVGEMAVRTYAKSQGIGDEFASTWLQKHPEVGLYGLRDVNGKATENLIDSPSFDPETRTLHVGAQMPFLSQLKRDFDAQTNALGRGVGWLTDSSRTAGEKAGDVASAGAHALDIVTRPLQAASVGVAGQQRAAGAMLAALAGDKDARDILDQGLYDPTTQLGAMWQKIRTGETPAGYESPIGEGADLLSQMYGHEHLPSLARTALDVAGDPLTYLGGEGVNELGASVASRVSSYAARIASDLPGASRASAFVERAARALSNVHDPRVEKLFDEGGRVLDLRPTPKDPESFFVTIQAGDGSHVRVNTATGEFTELGDAPLAPETPETLAAQVEAMKAGRRAVVHVTPDAINDPAQKVVVPVGMRSFGTPEGGRIIYNPQMVERAEVARRMDDGSLGELMGHIEPKPENPAGVVVARDGRTGAEIQSSYVSSPEKAAEQAQAFSQQHPGSHVEVGGVDLEKQVLDERAAGAQGSGSAPAGDELDELLKDVPPSSAMPVDRGQPLPEYLAEMTGASPAPELQGAAATPTTARGVAGRVAQTASDIINLPKSLKSSFALHGPFRQGIPQVLAHPSLLNDALTTQAKAFASEDAFQTFARGVMERPDFKLMQESGLFLPSTYDIEFAGRAPAAMREERFASNVAEKIPGVRASGRAYHAAMDSLRVHAWDTYMADLAGNPNVTQDTYKAVADLINVTTGRGTVPLLDRSAAGRKLVTLLNNPLWSPRAMASRFNILSPARLIENAANPATRPVAWMQLRDGMRAATTLTTTMGLLSLVPGVKGGFNPYQSNFGKVSIGNTHYDLVDGIPATARYAAQMARAFYLKESGKSIPKGQSPADLTKDFLRRRLSPSAQVAVDAYTGKTVEGKPFTKTQAARDLLTPFVVEDMYKAYEDAGVKGLPKALPGFFGVPSSTYKERGGHGSHTSAGPSSTPEDFQSVAGDGSRLEQALGEVLPPDRGEREIADPDAQNVARLLDGLNERQIGHFVKGLGEFEGMGVASPLADAASYAGEYTAGALGNERAAGVSRAMRQLARESRLRPQQFYDDVLAGRYGQSLRERYAQGQSLFSNGLPPDEQRDVDKLRGVFGARQP
jgi:hypothetical protein